MHLTIAKTTLDLLDVRAGDAGILKITIRF
jgi:hypothetical protein